MKLIVRIFLIVFAMTSQAYATNISEHFIQPLDKSRNRIVPLAIYKGRLQKKLPIVIINHGYGVKNTEYSFIAKALAELGYFVVSIQHDLKNDPKLSQTGNLFQIRKPLWNRGVQNILFTIAALKKIHPDLDSHNIVLIGHSNGGDISMLFTELHPDLITKVISLDSLRYPFPIKNQVPILSIRANDTKADKGVLPKTGATLVAIKKAKHIDLCDRGSMEVKHKVVHLILKFMDNKPLNQLEHT